MALTSFAKKGLVGIAIVGALSTAYYFKDSLMPSGGAAKGSMAGLMTGGTAARADGECIRLGINDWSGYAGLAYMNGGQAKTTADSRMAKEFGICVEITMMNDVGPSRDAWKAGTIDGLWGTIDAFPPEAPGLADMKPIVGHQVDWSWGGDVIVAQRFVNKPTDLKGKTIAVADFSPSMTLLLWFLDANGMTLDDVKLNLVGSGLDAAAAFKAGRVDAAVVWSPDDKDCIDAQKGSKVLVSTKQATNLIADVIYYKKDFVDNNREKLVKLTQAWLTGNATLNKDTSKWKEAAEGLHNIFGAKTEFYLEGIGNVKLATYGDNLQFFGLDAGFRGIKGEDLYNKMTSVYQTLGKISGRVPSWRTITDVSLIEAAGKGLDGKPEQQAERVATFEKPTVQEEVAPAISSKPVTISFASGSAVLDENAKYIVDEKLVDLAKAFQTSRIRLEGNTDAVGGRAANIALSKARAQSLATYLAKEHGFDPDRFVVVGNGPDKPLCTESTAECLAKNRRTEFQILQ